jgi:hypothetical protein
MAENSAMSRPSAAFDVAISRMASLAIAWKQREKSPNFPLPRELRDQIYQYLLHSDYTRVERKRKHPNGTGETNYLFERKGYKFHTNVLAVNSAIHDEAQDYLYKNNIFVIASADWLDASGGSFFTVNSYLPIVTESKAARMKHHSLRMHVAKNFTAITTATQSCLLLWKDLDALIVTLRTQVSQRLGLALMMEDNLTSPSAMFNVLGMNEHESNGAMPCRFKVQFLDTPWRKQDANTLTQRNVLDSLREFNCTGMRVTFDGVLPEHIDHAERVKNTMGAVLISPLALDWLHLDTYYKKKALADKAVCAGELGLAEIAYKILYVDMSRHIRAQQLTSADWPTRTPLNVLRLDVLLTLYYLELKLDRFTKREDRTVTKRLTETMAEFEHQSTAGKTFDSSIADLLRSLKGACRHFILLEELYGEESRRFEPTLTVNRLVKKSSTCVHLPYNSYDLAILSQVPNQKAPARKHLPKEKCSVFMLEPQCFNFHQMPAVPKKPDYVVGMQIFQVLRNLDDATKKSVKSIERQLGPNATDWE